MISFDKRPGDEKLLAAYLLLLFLLRLNRSSLCLSRLCLFSKLTNRECLRSTIRRPSVASVAAVVAVAAASSGVRHEPKPTDYLKQAARLSLHCSSVSVSICCISSILFVFIFFFIFIFLVFCLILIYRRLSLSHFISLDAHSSI